MRISAGVQTCALPISVLAQVLCGFRLGPLLVSRIGGIPEEPRGCGEAEGTLEREIGVVSGFISARIVALVRRAVGGRNVPLTYRDIEADIVPVRDAAELVQVSPAYPEHPLGEGIGWWG